MWRALAVTGLISCGLMALTVPAGLLFARGASGRPLPDGT